MKFILTGVEVSSAEKSSLYILDSLQNNGGSYPYPPPSPSYRTPEMASIPENRISMCSRTSSNSADSRTVYQAPGTPIALNPSVMVMNSYPQRLSSSHSYDSRQSFDRHSFHSNSSSSMGSLDVLEECGTPNCFNVQELVMQGHKDEDIIYMWLQTLRFDMYAETFISAGYDLPTITRMTPEDLTAIGITKPGHRKRLKREIAKLIIGDGLPDCIPTSVQEWLNILRLEEYYESLVNQKYTTIDSLININWEDMEDIGINKLGHQKKITIAVEKLKKLVKRRSASSSVSGGSVSTPISVHTPRWSADVAKSAPGPEMPELRSQRVRASSGDVIGCRRDSRESSPYSQAANRSVSEIVNLRTNLRYGAQDVQRPIMSRSSSGNSVNSSDYSQPPNNSYSAQPDRHSPPSSEDSASSCSGSMQRPPQKKGPMRGIHGLSMSKHSSQDSIDQHRNSMEAVSQFATLRRTTARKQSSQSLDFNSYGQGAPPSPVSKSSGTGGLTSPFANFKSPYAQIQSGEVRNVLGEKRSSSVPSSPVTKTPGEASLSSQTRRAPAPPKRTNSVRSSQQEGSSLRTPESDDEIHYNFPPPLPPVEFNLEAMKGYQTRPKQTSTVPDRRSAASPQKPETLKLQDVGISSLAARRRRASNSDNKPAEAATDNESNNNNSATSTLRNSIDTIPFANEEVGTIRRQDAPPSFADYRPGSSTEERTESEDNSETEFDFDTVKRNPKPVMHVQPVPSEKSAAYTSEPQPSPLKKNEIQNLENMFDSCLTGIDAMLT